MQTETIRTPTRKAPRWFGSIVDAIRGDLGPGTRIVHETWSREGRWKCLAVGPGTAVGRHAIELSSDRSRVRLTGPHLPCEGVCLPLTWEGRVRLAFGASARSALRMPPLAARPGPR